MTTAKAPGSDVLELPETDLPSVPDYDPELEPVDGEAVVVPGQRPGPTEPLPISTEM